MLENPPRPNLEATTLLKKGSYKRVDIDICGIIKSGIEGDTRSLD